MSTEQPYKRLVIVDPQLKDDKGHNFRYATRLAKDIDLPTEAICHRDLDGSLMPDGVKARPDLTFEQYNNTAFKDSFKESLFAKLERRYDQVKNRIQESNGIWEKDSPIGRFVAFSFWVLNVLLFLPALIRQFYILLVGRGSSVHDDFWASELKDALNRARCGQGDLVVFQTMLWPTFESLLELRLDEQFFECDAVFIVHEDWLIYKAGVIRFTPDQFQKRVLESLPFRRSMVLSTNENLSDYCETVSGYRPNVVKEISFPVEVEPHEHRESIGRVLVPGPYRPDKNFESLGRILEEICPQNPNLMITLHSSVMAQVDLPTRFADQLEVYSDVAGSKEWLEFINSFDLIVLPYGDAYRRRISGILHEARQLRIPIICSQDIADARIVADSSLLFDWKADLDDKTILKAFSAVLAMTSDASVFVDAEPPSLLEHVETGKWVSFIEKPIAVQVKPMWTRCGTSAVLDQQMEYLVSRNYFLIEVYVKPEPWTAEPEQVEFMYQVMLGGREFAGGAIARFCLKNIKLIPLLTYSYKLLRWRLGVFQERENIHGEWCTPDKKLLSYLKSRDISLTLVNHLFNVGMARKYFSAKTMVCETHDLQTNQLVKRRDGLNYHDELNYEISMLSEFDLVVNLNKVEQKIMSASLSNCVYIRPPVEKRIGGMEYETLGALLEAESRLTKPDIAKTPEKFDLLIIGDSHPSNISSLNQFLVQVFPSLASGVTLGVVGKVANHIEPAAREAIKAYPTRVYEVGFLQNISNVYDFTNIVVLPDTEGEGIPIKVDEALAHEKAFVATAHAMRGFDYPSDSSSIVENLEDLDEPIGRLLENACYSDSAIQLSRSIIEAHKPEVYRNQWDEALQAKGG